jgi:hypothetical protein
VLLARGHGLEPGGDVHAVAVDPAIPVHQHVPDVDAHAEFHAPGLGQGRISLAYRLLDRDRRFEGIDHRREFREDRIYGRIDDAASAGGDGIGKDLPALREGLEGGLVVVLPWWRWVDSLHHQFRRCGLTG